MTDCNCTGGVAPVVFEVTDLVIPAGTDWSHEAYVLGAVTYSRARLPVATMFISADSIAAGDLLYMLPVTNPANALSTSDSGPTIAGPSETAWASYYLPDVPSNVGITPDDDDLEFSIVLATAGPISADIHVPLARAVFLVL